MAEIVNHIRTRIRVDLEVVLFVLVTATALAAAASVGFWTHVAGLPLAAFVLIEGSGFGTAGIYEYRRNRRLRREAEIQAAARALAAQWHEARVQAAALRAAELIRTLEILRADTQVLPVVHSTVYQPRSHPVDDGRSIEMWARLNDDDTGDLATSY